MSRTFVVGDQLQPLPALCLRCGEETANRVLFHIRGTVPLIFSHRFNQLDLGLPVCSSCARRQGLRIWLSWLGVLGLLAAFLYSAVFSFEHGLIGLGLGLASVGLVLLLVSTSALKDLVPWLAFRVRALWTQVDPLRIRLTVGNEPVAARLAAFGVQQVRHLTNSETKRIIILIAPYARSWRSLPFGLAVQPGPSGMILEHVHPSVVKSCRRRSVHASRPSGHPAPSSAPRRLVRSRQT